MKMNKSLIKDKMTSFKKSPAFSGFILFLISFAIYLVVQFMYDPSAFFTSRTASGLFIIIKNYSPLIILTMGQALLMLLGIIDISIGIQLSFANVLAVNLPLMFGMPAFVGWILAVVFTMVLAGLNGVIVSKLRIPPLLAGYAMIYIVKGINLFISPTNGGKVPTGACITFTKVFFNVLPCSAIIIALCVLGWVFFKKLPIAKQVYAVGGNERNAFANGIDSVKVKIKIYVIVGFLTGIAGLCYTAAYSTGNPISGEIYGLQTISACILGGIALSGGIGTMACALFGIGFQVLIQSAVPKIFSLITRVNGVTYSTYWQNLLSDTIILIGLVVTIIYINKSQEDIKKGLKKQILGGDKNAECEK